MLFNSYVFLLGFAPIAFVGFFWIGRRSRRLAAGWLTGMSIVFYGWWNPYYVPILCASILFNFAFGRLIAGSLERRGRRRWLLAIPVTIDLVALGYFKYANFLVSNVAALSGLDLAIAQVALPLGISFYTFTQIAYLVDTYRGKATEKDLLHYVLFVTYFPHLIAGPIIHHKDVMPQFAKPDTYRFSRERLAIGAVFLLLGLFKKCFLADGVAVFAAPVFEAAEHGQSLSLLQAWGGALAYTFQLYFDFSGYSDMAVGLSLMLNVKLPFNFDSPYKAVSIADFWRRWHISLSTFLRDYLYIPLGGSRVGPARRRVNLMLTMLIGGLWHGAGWTFVAWGGLHGLYLVVNHQWTATRARWGVRVGRVEVLAGAALTFLAVVVAWVFFRAASFDGAAILLKAMVGLGNATVPLPDAFDLAANWTWCIVLLGITTLLPNTQTFVAARLGDWASISVDHRESPVAAWSSTSLAMASGLGLLAGLALMNLSRPSEFLYFNF